jgi:hypothetical protein
VLENYLKELFTFTIEAYQVGSASIKFHASVMNQVWNRIITECTNMSIGCQSKVEDLIDQIIAVYIEENLR